MEGLIIHPIFFVIVIFICAFLTYKVQILKIDLNHLERKLEIKFKFLNTLHTGLQTEVTTHRARERTLDRQHLEFLEANEDLFKDDISFQILSDLLKREV